MRWKKKSSKGQDKQNKLQNLYCIFLSYNFKISEIKILIVLEPNYTEAHLGPIKK